MKKDEDEDEEEEDRAEVKKDEDEEEEDRAEVKKDEGEEEEDRVEVKKDEDEEEEDRAEVKKREEEEEEDRVEVKKEKGEWVAGRGRSLEAGETLMATTTSVEVEGGEVRGSEQPNDSRNPCARDFPWGSYSLGTALIITWFYMAFLRAFYGGVIHLTSLFGCTVSAVLLFVYGVIMFAAGVGLLTGRPAAIKAGIAGLLISGTGHLVFVWVNRQESVWLETIAGVAAVFFGLRYLISENTSELVLQPESDLPTHIKVLQASLAGFGFICLAAVILTMWEPYGQAPLGAP